MTPPARTVSVLLAAALAGACGNVGPIPEPADILLLGGTVYDGSGAEPVRADLAIAGDRISFVGDAAAARVTARDTVDVAGLMVTPGFIDMHSHAELDYDYGRDAAPFLFQGITTVVLGVDGSGTDDLHGRFTGWLQEGIGVNGLQFVGHNAARRAVMGNEARAPTAAEMDSMKAYVRRGMEAGALGLSTGLFYVPGTYADTEEVVALNRVAAEYGGIYDTHDRDLGADYQGIGYDASVMEAIEIGERAGTPVIFSHFNPQGAHNYGRASVGARLIEEARARGVDVRAAQHVYTATQANLRSYTVPSWAAAGGDDAMRARFDDPVHRARLDRETMEMLDIRGGAEKILFADPRPDLNGKTLAQVAEEWNMSVPQTVRQILRRGNAVVMNLELYDDANTRYLARQEWMMTCTDGRTPAPGQVVTHPRVYGAFTRKLRTLVLDDGVISMPFAIRSMSGLAAEFLRLEARGFIRPGMHADVAVFRRDEIRDRADYMDPHHYSEGTVHVLVNGRFALRDGQLTGTLAGVPLLREGRPFQPAAAR
jgi:N-acyl-D-amino-acid deacylase